MRPLLTILLLITTSYLHAQTATWERLNELGLKEYSSGNYSQATIWFEKAVEQAKVQLGSYHPEYATLVNNLAFLYDIQGLYTKAEPLYIEVKSIREKILGKAHPDYLISLGNLAYFYKSQGVFEKAEPLYIKVKNIREKVSGKENPDYVTSLNNLAFLYKRQREFAKAEPLYIEAKNISEKIAGKETQDYAMSINNLATLYDDQGLFTIAEALYLESIDILKRILRKDHPFYTTALNNLALLFVKQSLYTKAEPVYVEIKSIREKVLGKEHPDYSLSLNDLAGLYFKQGQYAKAEPLYIEYKNLTKKVLGTSHTEYALALNRLGMVYKNLGQYSKAETLFIECNSIYKSILGNEHYNFAISLINLAALYDDQGQYIKAEPLYIEAKILFEKTLTKEHPHYAASLNNLAGIYHKQGLYSRAEALYIESKNITEKISGKEHPNYALALSNLSVLYLDQGKFTKAESLSIESKNIREKALGKEHPDYMESLNNLSVLYRKMGQNTKAVPLYLEAKNICENVLGREHPSYAQVLNNLGVLYSEQGKYAMAEPLYIESKDIREKVFGKEHPNYSESLDNLGVLYTEQGHYAKAESLFLESINISEKLLRKEYPYYASTLCNLGVLYSKQGQYSKAEVLYLEVKNIREKVLGKEHPDYATTLSNIGSLYDDQGKYGMAEPVYIEGNQVLLHQFNNNVSHLSEKERGVYFNTFSYNFEIFNSFMLKRMGEKPSIINEAYRNILATKGLLFDSQQKVKNRILSSDDPDLIALYDTWQGQLAYLSALYQKTIPQRVQAGINLQEEEGKANELEKQLSARSEFYAKANDKNRYTWRDIQKSLGNNEAAVEMVRFKYYDKKWTDSVIYIAMIVKPETIDHPALVVLENGNELEELYLRNYKTSIKSEREDKESYIQYWSKIKQALHGVKRVFLSLDGVYHAISLDGLLNPETRQYLADELDIRIVASTRDLVTAKHKKNPTKEIKLLGFPDYNGKSTVSYNQTQEEIDNTSFARVISSDSLSRFFNGSDITPLPGTQTEVIHLSKMMKASGLLVSLYTEGEATEETIKSWQNPMIAHIATHGYFLKDDEIRKDNNERIGGISREALFDNPLLRSGLLLANAKEAIQNGGDGVLTAFEAKSLNLDETELVVLSACETGLGDVKNGEGVYGLQRAFQAAGAASVLMSLWSVSDEATQELMTTFYQNWIIKKQTKRQAFRNAQLSLRTEYPHPFYWAAFVMVGE